MGYTHYWRFKNKPSEIEDGKNKFQLAVNLFKNGLEKMPDVKLANGRGSGKPEINDNLVCFNGVGNESYETCYIPFDTDDDSYIFDFCKTARMPYDVAVCLLLLCFKEAFGKDFNFSSDGNIKKGEEGWERAKIVFKQITNETNS